MNTVSNDNTNDEEPKRREQPSWEALGAVLGFTPRTLRTWRESYQDAPQSRSVVDWCEFIVREGLGDSHFVSGQIGAVDIARLLQDSENACMRAWFSSRVVSPEYHERTLKYRQAFLAAWQGLYDELDNITA